MKGKIAAASASILVLSGCGTYIGGAMGSGTARVGSVQVSKDSPVWAACKTYTAMKPHWIDTEMLGSGSGAPTRYNPQLDEPILANDSKVMYGLVDAEKPIHPWFAQDLDDAAHGLHEATLQSTQADTDELSSIVSEMWQVEADCDSFHLPHVSSTGAPAKPGLGLWWLLIGFGIWFAGIWASWPVLTLMDRRRRRYTPGDPTEFNVELVFWPIAVPIFFFYMLSAMIGHYVKYVQYTPAERKAKSERLQEQQDELAILEAEKEMKKLQKQIDKIKNEDK